jgi:hypothetical protein
VLGFRHTSSELVQVVKVGARLPLDPVGGGDGKDPHLGLGACKRLLDVEPRLDECRGVERLAYLLAAEEVAEDGAVQRRDRPAQ